jgi:hypothetical protein
MNRLLSDQYKNPVSRIAFLLGCLLIWTCGIFYYPKWKQPGSEATISWDVSGYYLYLPATFIYHDLRELNFRDTIMARYAPTPDFQQAYRHPSGNFVLKYSCGQAILFAPFFIAGHISARYFTSFPADGFSPPYQVAIGLGMLLYACLGLYFLRRVLLRYFPDTAVALTLLTIPFATNYLNYTAIDGAMTHNSLFLLYAVLLCVSDDFYRRPTAGRALAIGLLVAFATLVRPTELLSCLLPLLWGMRSVRERARFLQRYRKLFLLAVITAGLLLFVQLIYWKSMTGHWLVYSYGDEGFDFLHPHFYSCLFSYKSGWLLYSPAMLLAVTGFVFLYRAQRQIFWPSLLFTLLFAWICFSWKVWWYGASLGQRAMIQAYPVLAFPMTAFFAWTQSRRRALIVVLLFLAFCTWYNLWLTHQAHRGGLYKPEEMNGPYFRAVFGRSTVPAQTMTLLDNDALYDHECLPDPMVLYRNSFESDTSGIVSDAEAISGKSTFLDREKQFTPEYTIPIPPPQRPWLRAAADFRTNQKEWTRWTMPQMLIRFYAGDQIIQTNSIRIHRFLSDGISNHVYMDVRVPHGGFDKVTLLFWNAGGDKKTVIDNVEVLSF